MLRVVKNKKKNCKKIYIFFLIIFLIMFLISLYKIIEWKIYNNADEKILEELENTINIEAYDDDLTYNIDFKTLKEKNHDMVAWIKVNGTSIEYPVVQTTNNNYYLKYNFYKEYNPSGWIFADYRNKLDGTDNNIIVYGHNVKDGSMFNSLKNVLKSEWYENKDNSKIIFVTENEIQQYEVFSVYKILDEGYYIKTEFENNEFGNFLNTIKKRSIYDFNVELSETNQILTLSTCASNNAYRIVVHAKKQ